MYPKVGVRGMVWLYTSFLHILSEIWTTTPDPPNKVSLFYYLQDYLGDIVNYFWLQSDHAIYSGGIGDWPDILLCSIVSEMWPGDYWKNCLLLPWFLYTLMEQSSLLYGRTGQRTGRFCKTPRSLKVWIARLCVSWWKLDYGFMLMWDCVCVQVWEYALQIILSLHTYC